MTEQRGSSTHPSSELTPEQLAAENALICAKLLGLMRHCNSPSCPDWRTADGKRFWANPTFDNWAEAGLILDVLAAHGIRWHLTRSVHFGVYIFSLDPIGSPGGEWREKRDRSGPLAIRAAALEYIKATQVTDLIMARGDGG